MDDVIVSLYLRFHILSETGPILWWLQTRHAMASWSMEMDDAKYHQAKLQYLLIHDKSNDIEDSWWER